MHSLIRLEMTFQRLTGVEDGQSVVGSLGEWRARGRTGVFRRVGIGSPRCERRCPLSYRFNVGASVGTDRVGVPVVARLLEQQHRAGCQPGPGRVPDSLNLGHFNG